MTELRLILSCLLCSLFFFFSLPLFAQHSFCHCLIEYSISEKKVLRQIDLVVPDFVENIPLEEYPFEAAHHGIGLAKKWRIHKPCRNDFQLCSHLHFPRSRKSQDSGNRQRTPLDYR